MRLIVAAAVVAVSLTARASPQHNAALPAPAQSTRAMVLTFDDLPYVPGGQPNTLAAAQRVTSTLLRVLNTHSAPAVGFVNEGMLPINGEVDANASRQNWTHFATSLKLDATGCQNGAIDEHRGRQASNTSCPVGLQVA